MSLPLPASIKRRHRHTLRNIKSTFDSFIKIMSPSTQNPPPPSPPPFDPSQPSIPISYPLKTLEELASKAYFDSFHYSFNRATVKLETSNGDGDGAGLPNRPRMLVCHDMAGGYTDDKWIQGGENSEAYGIWHWYLMDVFVYFSHYLVTLPPPCWTNAAHKHGVKVLGTFIMEWDEGSIKANELLSTKESAHMYAERLAELSLVLGFDGWLINMEVEINNVPNLKEFITHLTQMMHSSVPGSLVIWYDSVTTKGKLDWQNQLNDSNKDFFDLCDGIFVNYTWKENYANLSAEVAGDRKFDVYMGIDVFGRGTYGGGQWTTNVALDVIQKSNVSAAIFAPGWVYENNDKNEFQTLQNRWWGLVEKSWGVVRKYPQRLPFFSNFDQGRGFHISLEGMQISGAHWNNISCQSYQPFLECPEESDMGSVQCSIDFKEASYSGGGNITFKGSLEKDESAIFRLFEADLLLGNSPVFLSYSVRSVGSSLLGLVLHLSSATNEGKKVLLASDGNALLTMEKFSSQFNHVIAPHQVTKLESEPGWTINDFSFAFNEHVVTKISALCYKLENISSRNSSDYYAVLGHILINGYGQNSQFPPSTSWLVENQFMKWSSASQESSLRLKLSWRLENGNAALFSKYNIYVGKISPPLNGTPGEIIHGLEEYLGVAETENFYVDDLVVPSDVSTLKFIVQSCSIDGSCQKLEESPFLQIVVEK